jgi:excinuclease ABC subunit C
MIEEVLQRRLKRAIEENNFPDLIIIDGGKGQLNIALNVLKKIQIYTPLTLLSRGGVTPPLQLGNAYMRSSAPDNIDVIALAKGKIRGRKKIQERVFIPHRKNPIIFGPSDPVLHLLERIRDEAHRFAITFHRKLRKKGTLQSLLDNIQGIGPKRKKALIEHFGDIESIKNASIEQLQKVKTITKKIAEKIHNYFLNEN